MLVLVLFVAAIFLLFWMLIEARAYRMVRSEIHINKKMTKPLRILHLSDTHFYRHEPKRRRFFQRLARENVDFAFITGDIIDSPEGIEPCCEMLRLLKPKIGCYAVLGNHDYFHYNLWELIAHNFPGQSMAHRPQPVRELVESLRREGVRILYNETAEIDHEGMKLLIHGLGNATTGHANLRATMQNFDPEKINILLTHTIDVFLEIGEGEIDLSFSGHSHGGQIRLPGYGAIVTHTIMGRDYAEGIITHKGAVCCVSKGLGTSRYLPVRFCCRPEAAIVEVCGSA